MLIETTYNGKELVGKVTMGDTTGDASVPGGLHRISPYVEEAWYDGVTTVDPDHDDALIQAAYAEMRYGSDE